MNKIMEPNKESCILPNLLMDFEKEIDQDLVSRSKTKQIMVFNKELYILPTLKADIKTEFDEDFIQSPMCDLTFAISSETTNEATLSDETLSADEGSEEPNTKPTTEKITWSLSTHKCRCCSATFPIGFDLFRHLPSVPGFAFECSPCVSRFFDYTVFINHMRLVHYDALKLCCDICNKYFENRLQIAIHRDKHNNTRLFPKAFMCAFCSRSYATMYELKNHLKLSHSYKCVCCKREFLGRSALDKHMENNRELNVEVLNEEEISPSEKPQLDDYAESQEVVEGAGKSEFTAPNAVEKVASEKSKPDNYAKLQVIDDKWSDSIHDNNYTGKKLCVLLSPTTCKSHGPLKNCTKTSAKRAQSKIDNVSQIVTGKSSKCHSKIHEHVPVTKNIQILSQVILDGSKSHLQGKVQIVHLNNVENAAITKPHNLTQLSADDSATSSTNQEIIDTIELQDSDDCDTEIDNCLPGPFAAMSKRCLQDLSKEKDICDADTQFVHKTKRHVIETSTDDSDDFTLGPFAFASKHCLKKKRNLNFQDNQNNLIAHIQVGPEIKTFPNTPNAPIDSCKTKKDINFVKVAQKQSENLTNVKNNLLNRSDHSYFAAKDKVKSTKSTNKPISKPECSPVKLQCPKCSLFSEDHHSFQVHLMQHEGKRPYVCRICLNKFPVFYDLKTHMDDHSQEFPYACIKCVRRFGLKDLLENHMDCHVQPCTCEICSKSFATNFALTNHIMTHI